MGIRGHLSKTKTLVSRLQRFGRKTLPCCNTVKVKGDEANANMTVIDPPCRNTFDEGLDSPNAGTGVYFQGIQVWNSIHPLQASQDCSLSSGLCSVFCDVPIGKPLAPPPALGHLSHTSKLKKLNGKVACSAPVKVAKLTKHRVVYKNDYSSLSSEEKLFLEAATSLRNAQVPSVIRLEARSSLKTKGLANSGLHRPV